MRALTLKPHWAYSVCFLGKRIENRGKPFPERLLGQRFAIHSGAESAFKTNWLDQIDADYPGSKMERREHVNRAITPVVMTPKLRIVDRGVMLARAVVATAVVRKSTMATPGEGGESPPWARLPRRGDSKPIYWWELEDVEVLISPILQRRGQLGLWTLHDEVSSQICETYKAK